MSATVAQGLRQVDALVAKRQLARILRTFEPDPLPIQIVYPHARHLSPNVRAFVDLAVPRLRARIPVTLR